MILEVISFGRMDFSPLLAVDARHLFMSRISCESLFLRHTIMHAVVVVSMQMSAKGGRAQELI